MRSLAVRLTLLGMFVAASGVSAYLFWGGEALAREDARAGRSFDERALVAARDIVELRAAEQSYVAAGQGDQFWSSRVTATLPGLKETVAALRASASSLRAQSTLDNASSSLQDFEHMDARAREYARSGQKLLAADLIFADGFEMTGAAIAALDQARAAELQTRDEAVAHVRQRQLFAAGAAAAAALLAIVLLVPRTEKPVAEPELIHVVPKPPEPVSPIGLNAGAEGWTAARRISEAHRAPARTSSIDVGSIAALCTDLALIVDTRSLPALLERAAVVLDASGIVLWISDPDGRELTPIVTHGYLPPVVGRLGTIGRDAQNATAAAFRTALVQTVKGDPVSNGAIAAPLLTPAGAVGVMAAEVRNGGERDAEKLAAAAIVAAQLATLVGPPSSRPQAKSEAAGA